MPSKGDRASLEASTHGSLTFNWVTGHRRLPSWRAIQKGRPSCTSCLRACSHGEPAVLVPGRETWSLSPLFLLHHKAGTFSSSSLVTSRAWNCARATGAPQYILQLSECICWTNEWVPGGERSFPRTSGTRWQELGDETASSRLLSLAFAL